FLAFLDLPNANVGFEIGYAVGRGKRATLARINPTSAPWIERPPLNGFFCSHLAHPQKIRDQIQSDHNWFQLPDALTGGTEVLVLCPDQGAAYLEEIPDEWEWRPLPPSGWDLTGLPEKLNGIGLVVWVITPHHEDARTAGRDGSENAALSVIAGYAEARPELTLRILLDEDLRTPDGKPRTPADVVFKA